MGAASFAIYTNSPYQPRGVVLAPSTGPGQDQSLQGISNGAASVTMTLGSIQRLVLRIDGVASDSSTLNYVVQQRMSSAGVGHFSSYAGTPVRGVVDIHGVGSFTNYLGTPIRAQMTSHGIASMEARAATSYQLAFSPHGVGHLTNYLAGPTPLAATFAGRAAVTARLDLAGRLETAIAGLSTVIIDRPSTARALAIAPHGVSTFSIDALGTASLTTPIHGVASTTFFQSSPKYAQFSSAGVGHMFPTIQQVAPDLVIAGAASMSSAMTRRVALRMTSHGVADMSVRGAVELRNRINGVGHMTPSMNGIFVQRMQSAGLSHLTIDAYRRAGLRLTSGGISTVELLALLIQQGAGDLLSLNFMRPRGTLVGQLYPRRIILPTGV